MVSRVSPYRAELCILLCGSMHHCSRDRLPTAAQEFTLAPTLRHTSCVRRQKAAGSNPVLPGVYRKHKINPGFMQPIMCLPI